MKEINKIEQKIFCEWCGHTDTYYVDKGDQPKCKKCFRFVKKGKS